MIIFTHGAAATICTYFMNKKPKDKNNELKNDLLLSFIFGILPDLPLTGLIILGKFNPNIHYHHKWITHTPIFWLLIVIIVYFILSKKVGKILLLSTWLHLAMDWYGGADGIPFLFPFSNRQFGALLSGINGSEGFLLYIKNPLFLTLELTVNIIFVIIIFTQLRKTKKKYSLS